MTPEQTSEIKKKITVVLVLGILFGVLYNFYSKMPEPKAKLVKSTINTVEKIREQKTAQEEPTEIVTVQEETTAPVLRKINPSNLDELASVAAKNIGKTDPFINNGLKAKNTAGLPAAANNNYNMTPVSNDLPTLSGNLPSPVDFLKTFNAVSDEPELKGFIGNKAIVSYKGIRKALYENQTIEDVKITDISPEKYKISYLKDGKIFSKSLNHIGNDDLGIIQKL